MTKPPEALAELEDLLDFGSGMDMRTTLLRVLTHLYLQRPTHTPEDEHYYTELALRLIDAADLPERAALAARLAPYSSAPRAVIERLARDVIEVAAPILKHSPCLSAGDLETIADQHGAAHAAVIAARSLPPASTAPAAASTEAAPVGACELSELFYAADAAERRLILLNLDYALLIPPRRLAAIQRGDIWRLEAAALQHNTETVVSELARSLDVSRAQARRIVNDEMGEPMVVAAKAVELPVEALRRVLLFMTPWAGQSVDRIYELAELYAEISVEAACRLISIWRNADPAENGHIHYEPVGWPAAAENARRALSEGSRRPELQHDVRAQRRTIGGHRRSGDNLVEEMSPGTILNLDDPHVGIET